MYHKECIKEIKMLFNDNHRKKIRQLSRLKMRNEILKYMKIETI